MSFSAIIAVIISAVLSYLVTGLNPAIILSKLVYKKDIRNEGSGNPGFTNFKRVFGNKLAWFVFLFDISKALIVEVISAVLFSKYIGEEYWSLGVAISGVFAVLGHAFPVWYGFKGGKAFLVGVSTLFLLDWRIGLICFFGVLCLFLFTTHYMSLASILCILAGIPCLLIFNAGYIVTAIYAVSAIIITLRHKENIKRLISKTERKFYFGSKK